MSTQQRRSRSGFVGRLTALYRTVEAFMNAGGVEAVEKNIGDIDEAFLRFSRSHYEYFNALTDAQEIEDANRYYNDQLQRKSSVILRAKTWLRDNAVQPKDSASNVGSVTSSVALRRVKANEALAKLEVEQLKNRQRLLRQEEDMRMQRELLEAQYKLERAQLEVNIYNEPYDDQNGELELNDYEEQSNAPQANGLKLNDAVKEEYRLDEQTEQSSQLLLNLALFQQRIQE
ncbi:hypothetical protein AC249_AIPGENE2010 [Exaiptasia diaphana]|nr:hypothetical protein AC249_AIPGENE2010 [Exaiptasia diaphana]